MARTKLTNTVASSGGEEFKRVEIFNSVLQSLHLGSKKITDLEKSNRLKELQKFHSNILNQDPNFYGPLAVWYMDNGQVRDHKEIFIATLLCHEWDEYREAGFMLLQRLPVHQVLRTVNYIVDVLGKGKLGFVPRSTKKAVEVYLKTLENDDNSFDFTALKSRKSLKELYRKLKLRPSARAQACLFENNPPEDSLLFKLKEISKENDPTIQAELIVKYKIPYTTAVGVIKLMTPSILIALINQMTKQELLNNIKSIEAHGAYNNPQVTALVKSKLEKRGKIAALKTNLSVSNNSTVNTAVEKAATVAVKQLGTIKRSTALFVDSSGSMQIALEIGKRLGAAIATAMKEGVPFYSYVFDDAAQEVISSGKDLADFERAYRGIRAGGSTSIGAPLALMSRQKRNSIEQIIIVTDEGENATPTFVEAYNRYEGNPEVIIIRIGSCSQLENDLKRAKIPVEVFKWPSTGDYYSIPNIVAMLAKGSQLDLIFSIMETRLPKRPSDLSSLYRKKSVLKDATGTTSTSLSVNV